MPAAGGVLLHVHLLGISKASGAMQIPTPVKVLTVSVTLTMHLGLAPQETSLFICARQPRGEKGRRRRKTAVKLTEERGGGQDICALWMEEQEELMR